MSADAVGTKSEVEEETGQVLRDNNQQIVQYLNWLRKQRKDSEFLIQRQIMEKAKIENDIEMLTFKLTRLCRSMNQRIIASSGYEKTIQEIEEKYAALVAASGDLLTTVSEQAKSLEEIMDKNVGTSQPGSVIEVKLPSPTQSIAPEPQQEEADTVLASQKVESEEPQIQSLNEVTQPPKAEDDKVPLSTRDHRASYAIQGEIVDRLFGEQEPTASPVVESKILETLSEVSEQSLMSAIAKDEQEAQNNNKINPLMVLTPIMPNKTSMNSEVSVSMFGEAYSRQHSSQVPLTVDKTKQTKHGRDTSANTKRQNKNYNNNNNDKMDE